MQHDSFGETPAGDDRANPLHRIPQLPTLTERWTVQRKVAVIEAVRGGWVTIDELCRLCSLSVEEFMAWERDLERYGMHGLRSTRYQIYRDTDAARRA